MTQIVYPSTESDFARDAIVAAMRSVIEPDGVVQPFQRYAKEMQALKAFYVAPGSEKLHGWFVAERSIVTAGADNTGDRATRTRGWLIRGFYALDDQAQSEILFSQLIARLQQRFFGDPTLGGVCVSTSQFDPPHETGLQVREIENYSFCGVLCHATKIELRTFHFTEPVEL